VDYFYSAAMRRSRGALWPSFAPALIGLGIYAVAALTSLPNRHHSCCLILFAGCLEENRLRTRSTTHHSTKGRLMKKKSQIEIERRIVSSPPQKREINKPRLTESARNGSRAEAAPTVEKPVSVLREREP